MTMTQESTSYTGVLRVLDPNTLWLLDVGKGDLEMIDPDIPSWGGTLTVSAGSALHSKSITATVELGDGSRARAQVGTKVEDAGPGMIKVKVVGLGPWPSQ